MRRARAGRYPNSKLSAGGGSNRIAQPAKRLDKIKVMKKYTSQKEFEAEMEN